jgi:hypothetical protein
MPDQPKPLIVLTADHNALFGLTALLRRADELGIHPIDFDAYPHPNRDNGVRRRADVFLRSFLQWEHALVVFDREGSGSEDAAEVVESEVESRLNANGWQDRCAVVAIEPELESWVWDSTLQADQVLGWPGGEIGLRDWLQSHSFLQPGQMKPPRPKEAFEAALRERKIRRSSALYGTLASTMRTRRCTDRAFCRMAAALKRWFPKP